MLKNLTSLLNIARLIIRRNFSLKTKKEVNMCNKILWDSPGIDEKLVKHRLMEVFQIGEIVADLKDIRWFLELTKSDIGKLQSYLKK